VKPLSEHDVVLREQIRRYILEHSESWHREHLGKLAELWGQWNNEHFAAEMVWPVILLNEPSNPRRLGDCASISGMGCRSQIRIRPSLLTGTYPGMNTEAGGAEGRFLYTADVLLHEMIHQWQQEVTGQTEESYHGHGTKFRDKANEIGAKLGLPLVRAKHERDNRVLCQYWPHEVRPEDFDRGAFVTTSRDGTDKPKGFFVPEDFDEAIPVLREHFDVEELCRRLGEVQPHQRW
jgi:hypothetical protein